MRADRQVAVSFPFMSEWIAHVNVYAPAARAGAAWVRNAGPVKTSLEKTVWPLPSWITTLWGTPSWLSNASVHAVFAGTATSVVTNTTCFAATTTDPAGSDGNGVAGAFDEHASAEAAIAAANRTRNDVPTRTLMLARLPRRSDPRRPSHAVRDG